MNPQLDEKIKRAERDCIKANTEYVIAREKLLILRDEAKRLFTPSCPTCKNYERKGEPVRYNCYDCAHFDPDKSCSPCHWEPKIEPEPEPERRCISCKHYLTPSHRPPCCVCQCVGDRQRERGDRWTHPLWEKKPEEKPAPVRDCSTCQDMAADPREEPCCNCERLPSEYRMDHYKEKTT